MIIKSINNIPVASFEITDFAGALAHLKVFKNDNTLLQSDLIKLLSTPGTDRDEFIESFIQTDIVINDRYVKQILTL